jgi:hypothetical protein
MGAGGYGPPGTGSPDGGTPGPANSGPGGYPPGFDPNGNSQDGSGQNPDGSYGQPAPPPKPTTLRDKAIDAFKAGEDDEAFELLAAHYLTTPGAGTELGRNMQWATGLRRPALATRFGVAIIYSAPFNWDGHPQPLGSAELEAALGEIDGQNNQGGGGGERRGNSRAFGGGRNRNREGRGGGNIRGPMPPAGVAGGFNPGGEGGMQEQPETAREELEYFTGELGAKLLTKLKSKMEVGTFGVVLKDANKAVPLPAANQADADGAGGFQGPGAGRMAPAGVGPGPGGPGRPLGPGAPGGPGAGEGGDEAIGGPVLTGQLIPGVSFLGAVENVKQLGEVVASSAADVIFVFEVKVRPASASNWVNNDTRLRVVSAAKVSENLFTSSTINNKGVTEARKKKGGEDPVNQELTEALDVVEQQYKMQPLPPAVTAEVALKRINALAATKPDDALPLLLEARFYVAKKLLKPEEFITVALTEVGEDQLGNFSRHLDGDDVKERIATALSGNAGDRPKTVLGKFGDALMGAGGIGNLVPLPELPPIALPGSAPTSAPAEGVPEAGRGRGPGLGPMPGALAPQGPAPSGPAPVRGGLGPQGPGGPQPMPLGVGAPSP